MLSKYFKNYVPGNVLENAPIKERVVLFPSLSVPQTLLR